jgi:hypothetical protein
MVAAGSRARFVLMALTLLLVPACTGSDRVVGEVEGTVRYNKQPLPGVIVEFLPDSEQGTRGPRSRAVTDEQGHYTLQFDDEDPGAVVGHHRVVVRAGDEQTDRGRKTAGHAAGGRTSPGPRGASLADLLDRYKKATTTPLKREVHAGKQTIDLDLP